MKRRSVLGAASAAFLVPLAKAVELPMSTPKAVTNGTLAEAWRAQREDGKWFYVEADYHSGETTIYLSEEVTDTTAIVVTPGKDVVLWPKINWPE